VGTGDSDGAALLHPGVREPVTGSRATMGGRAEAPALRSPPLHPHLSDIERTGAPAQ